MTRNNPTPANLRSIRLTCCLLILSAFALGGLLVTHLQTRITNPAHAGMTIQREAVSLMTGQTRPDEEAVFVLDGFTEKLLIYRVELGKSELELAGSIDLPSLFSRGKGGTGNRTGRRGTR